MVFGRVTYSGDMWRLVGNYRSVDDEEYVGGPVWADDRSWKSLFTLAKDDVE